ncbi:hypothetical protein [Pseudomonas oryzihabitans]|uniref:hypothetical protein n=1 Tax=Pseudomonas oryzihabitans TaxID=47885 RepID=UPI0021D83369|nr:hypothetical protein [Pseudomonas oryzihabitans]
MSHRFTDHSEDLDTFDKQQEMFQPCQLRYAKNLVDLLTDELAGAREMLGRYQRDNLRLLAEHDAMTAEVKRIRGELMAWNQYKIACRTSGTALANRLLPILPEQMDERRHHNLVSEIAHLKRQLEDARKRLQGADTDIQRLYSQVRHYKS